ncbi:MAG: hypothetical protein ING06_20275 [Roseomonas sp.]|nr:hypothetical protein [Roseomonas sp.]
MKPKVFPAFSPGGERDSLKYWRRKCDRIRTVAVLSLSWDHRHVAKRSRRQHNDTMPMSTVLGEEEFELDRIRWKALLDSLDGRRSKWSKYDEIRKCLKDFYEITNGREHKEKLPSDTAMKDWAKTENKYAKPVTQDGLFYLAIFWNFGKLITSDDVFINKIFVHPAAQSLIEVGRLTLESLGENATRPYKIRLSKLELTPTTRQVVSPNDGLVAWADIGFINVYITLKLEETNSEENVDVLIDLLDSTKPRSQHGAVIGATFQHCPPDVEWRMLKQDGDSLNIGTLANASLAELQLSVQEKIQLLVTVRNEDFQPIIRLPENLSVERTTTLNTVARRMLEQQVLKTRVDTKRRHILAQAIMVAR